MIAYIDGDVHINAKSGVFTITCKLLHMTTLGIMSTLFIL